MTTNLKEIKQICHEIWDLTVEFREAVFIAERWSEKLSLTSGQKKIHKDEFLKMGKKLEEKVKELQKKIN